MEPVTYVITVASLAGVFTSCIQCFDLIRLGSEFGNDYGKCLLRLDVSKLRLARWGWSVGLGEPPAVNTDFHPTESDIRTAQKLLSSIYETFQDVEKASKKYPNVDDPRSKEIPDESTALEQNIQRLHISMRKTAATRHSDTSLLSRAAWAIYRKKHFDRMVEDITEFVNSLIDLFPTALPTQQSLAISEADGIQNTDDLRLLQEVSQEDPILENAVKESLSARGSFYNQVEATDSSKLHAGDDIAYGVSGHGHVFNGGKSSGNAVAHFGNNYRGAGGI